MLSDQSMIWPMFAHVMLVFGLYVLLSKRRFAAVKAGRATVSQFRENLSEPEDSLFVHNNLKNQFELPIFFHVGCIAVYILNADNFGTVAVAWLFVVSRFAHSYIHVTSNRIRHRRAAFIVGLLSLLAMWGWVGVWMVLT
ncbi:MAPEG family protein [Rhizobium oryzicola]|uniref:MAPEG family protein n=1 Tax=Rhizobium oryzicola TaxID=1232668 RepID=UPI003F52E788